MVELAQDKTFSISETAKHNNSILQKSKQGRSFFSVFLYVKIIFSENIHIYNVVFNDA